jgi:hypothetical protein
LGLVSVLYNFIFSFVVSGHVKTVEYHPVDPDVPYCALRAEVIPSQRITEKPHKPWAYVNKTTAEVLCGHCTCMAGLGEVCSHVAALLFKVEIGVKLGLNSTASTSTACKWNNAFRKEIEPMDLKDIQRHISGLRVKQIESNSSSGKEELPPLSSLESLKKVCPNAVFFLSVPPLDPDETETCSDNHDPEVGLQLLRNLYEPGIDAFEMDFQKKCEEIWEVYKKECTQELIDGLEAKTRLQSQCSLWLEHRKGRISASKFHDVVVRRDSTNPKNLVLRIIGNKSYDLSSKSEVKWGLNNEEKARNEFIDCMRSDHPDLQVAGSGLLVSKEYPFLGASADGIVTCGCCPKRVLEIKCPYKHRNNTISEAVQTDTTFCLDRTLHLKKSHRYYSQIQLQIFVHGVDNGDFFVFTNKDSHCVNVHKDESFINEMIAKSESFFLNSVLPELVSRRLENGEDVESVPFADADCDEDVNLWCLCSEPEYGRMIQCTNEDCPIQWFHYGCINIRRRPRGDWLCPDCSL